MGRVKLLLIILFASFISCDPVYNARIVNETNQRQLLVIEFDSVELKKSWEGRDYLPFLKSYPGYTNINSFRFDTIKLIKYFIIQPNSSFPLSGANKNNYKLFNKILIGNNKIQLKNKEEIIKAFEKTSETQSQLVIKD